MKENVYLSYQEIKVTCSCGNMFKTGSTLSHDLTLEICSACHPFYTGQQKLVDTRGRLERFRKKYNKRHIPSVATSEGK